MEQRPKKLLDRVREAIQLKHYSIRTEESYVNWIRRYILFHNKRHPNEMGATEVEAFLTHLAVDEWTSKNLPQVPIGEVFQIDSQLLVASYLQPLAGPDAIGVGI
jgi:hypothetical protein